MRDEEFRADYADEKLSVDFLRKSLRDEGINTRGMSHDELEDLYYELQEENEEEEDI